MVKYVIVSNNVMPLPPLGYAGVEKLVFQLTVGLLNRGHEVILVAPDGTNITSKKMDMGKLKIIPSGPAMNDERSAYIKYKDAVSKIIESDPDTVMISHSWYGYELLFKIKYPKLKFMHTFHAPGGWPLPKDRKMRDMWLGGEFNFIGVSKYHARSLSEQMDGTPVNCIYNGVDPEEYKYREGSHNERKYDIAFVGVMNQGKGPLKLLQMLKNTKYRIIMAGEELFVNNPDYTDAVRNLASTMDNVEYYGFVSNGLKKEIFSKSKLLVYPYDYSWDEPFNLTVIEAGMMGLPSLLINRGSSMEISMPEFPPADTYEQLRYSIDEALKILSDTERMKEVSQKAIKHSMGFTLDKMIDRYETYFL